MGTYFLSVTTKSTMEISSIGNTINVFVLPLYYEGHKNNYHIYTHTHKLLPDV